MLQAKELVAGYRGTRILNEISIEIGQKEIVAIVGPNGAGKSTLFKALAGLLPLDEGSIMLDGTDITRLAPHLRINQGLAYLPQLQRVFPSLSVKENLEMGAFTARGATMRARMKQVLSLFPDLAAAQKQRAGTLSGGQQTMLGLARALMTNPKVLLLDEPTAGLSPLYVQRVWEQSISIRATGVGLIMIEQNVSMALDHADRAYVLVDGRVAAHDRAERLRNRSDVEGLFVG
jgi:ABC-type branched-subunit amino acid transport system ATPase component